MSSLDLESKVRLARFISLEPERLATLYTQFCYEAFDIGDRPGTASVTAKLLQLCLAGQIECARRQDVMAVKPDDPGCCWMPTLGHRRVR